MHLCTFTPVNVILRAHRFPSLDDTSDSSAKAVLPTPLPKPGHCPCIAGALPVQRRGNVRQTAA